ncbi:hypothetical protein T439DRAFT_380222 [Meredithblackwellia eburnea MCA 4105]
MPQTRRRAAINDKSGGTPAAGARRGPGPSSRKAPELPPEVILSILEMATDRKTRSSQLKNYALVSRAWARLAQHVLLAAVDLWEPEQVTKLGNLLSTKTGKGFRGSVKALNISLDKTLSLYSGHTATVIQSASMLTELVIYNMSGIIFDELITSPCLRLLVCTDCSFSVPEGRRKKRPDTPIPLRHLTIIGCSVYHSMIPSHRLTSLDTLRLEFFNPLVSLHPGVVGIASTVRALAPQLRAISLEHTLADSLTDIFPYFDRLKILEISCPELWETGFTLPRLERFPAPTKAINLLPNRLKVLHIPPYFHWPTLYTITHPAPVKVEVIERSFVTSFPRMDDGENGRRGERIQMDEVKTLETSPELTEFAHKEGIELVLRKWDSDEERSPFTNCVMRMRKDPKSGWNDVPDS